MTYHQTQTTNLPATKKLHALFAKSIAMVLMVFALGCGEYGGDESPIADSVKQPSTPQQALEAAAFEEELHPLLRQECTTCHDGTRDGVPSLAHFDAEEAWWYVDNGDFANFDKP